jgi:hypothetical protein
MNENKKDESFLISEELTQVEKEREKVREQLKMVGGDISDNAD